MFKICRSDVATLGYKNEIRENFLPIIYWSTYLPTIIPTFIDDVIDEGTVKIYFQICDIIKHLKNYFKVNYFLRLFDVWTFLLSLLVSRRYQKH